jgi:glutamine synthetase
MLSATRQISRLSQLQSLAGRSRNFATPASIAATGNLLLNDQKLAAAVGPDVWATFKDARESGAACDKKTANAIAAALKDFAFAHGAVNYAHWFSPVRQNQSEALNGIKHDSFIDLDFGSSEIIKPIVEDFSGGKLFFNETDGSSFPNGGLRDTHTAAAYMSWDRTSPPFVKGDTLYIPASFIAWTGAALDEKTPLLRSQNAINNEGLRLLRHLGDNDTQKVVSCVGWEQEFFIVDRSMWLERPDLISSGRTLIGAAAPRGQQSSANYFSRLHPRIKALMDDWCNAQIEVGICSAVFHNEVAPGQHEQSPVFSLTNVAADQNVLAMELLNDIAAEHDLVPLYHEKPFAGINGSGKHANWGLNTDTGKNLYAPGKTAETQGDFTTFVTALAHAITQHADVLRCSIATAGNDHRLGAQEAPPAILSLYTGNELAAAMKAVAYDGAALDCYGAPPTMIPSGSPNVSDIAGAPEDRNRTAPIPFCGNRFEFRAVGSSQNIAFPLAVLNTAVADGCAAISDKVEAGASPRDAVAAVLADNWHGVFNGDGYSDEWQVEAAERGLLNLKTTPEAWATFDAPKNVALFEKFGVLSAAETVARKNIALDAYTMSIEIEGGSLLKMLDTAVMPALAKDLENYQNFDAGVDRAGLYASVASGTNTLRTALDGIPEGEQAAADYCVGTLKPAMDAVRVATDQAENLCENWPYPSYQDLLFNHQTEAVN